MKTLTLAIFCLAVAPCAMAKTSLRSDIVAMSAKISKAMLKKDIDGFTKLVKAGITKDFKYEENGKAMSFDEMVEGMKQGFAMADKVTEASTKILSLKQKGNNATCKESHTMRMTTKGQDGKTHKMVFTGVSINTYRRENGKWLMSKMAWGSQKMTMDGKPMDMSQMGGG